MAEYGQSKKILAYALKALGQDLINRSDELAETLFGIGLGLVVIDSVKNNLNVAQAKKDNNVVRFDQD